MSYSLRIRASALPSYGDLARWAGFADLCCEPERTTEQGERVLPVYRYRLSTRSIELLFEREHASPSVLLRVLPGACETDIALLLRLAECCASELAALVELETGEALDGPALLARSDDAWVSELMAASAAQLANLAASRVITLRGPTRAYQFGPKLLARLSFGDPLPLHVKLRDSMLRMQWCDASGDIVAAKRLRANAQATVARWTPTTTALLPPVDFVAIQHKDSASPLIVPSLRLFEIVQGHAEALDESSILVPRCQETELPELLDRAQRHVAALELPREGLRDADEPELSEDERRARVDRAYRAIVKELPIAGGLVVVARLLFRWGHEAWAGVVLALVLLGLTLVYARYWAFKRSLGMSQHHPGGFWNRPAVLVAITLSVALGTMLLLRGL